jgi:hypothetical protein
MWGLNHSTFVTAPARVPVVLSSNSALQEWWATVSSATATTRTERLRAFSSSFYEFRKQSRGGLPFGCNGKRTNLYYCVADGFRYHPY